LNFCAGRDLLLETETGENAMARSIGPTILAFATALLAGTPAFAQGKYPDRPVRVILPFGAGGVADITTRIVTDKLGEKFGQRFVVENNAGAGGIAAARAVLQAPADGYTLALFSNGTAVSVNLFRNLPFDPLKDFVPVSAMGTFDLVFVTNAGGPYKTLGDFIKAAKEKPGQLNIGTIAAGSTQNLGAELFKSTFGLDIVVVPFKTSGEVLVGLERNDIQMAAEFFAALRGGLDAGKFVPVGVSGQKRGDYLPNAPTVREAAGGDFEATSWNAIFARAGTPSEIVATLNKALNEVLADPEIRRKALDLGIDARGSTPEEIAIRLKADIVKWGKVIETAGIEKR
jgi:tripartite-type tricarboxylate transporter receptor subunit TctC